MIGRRGFLASGVAAYMAASAGKALAQGQAGTAGNSGGMTPWPPADTFPIWPGKAPGARATLPTYSPKMEGAPGHQELHLRGIDVPRLSIYRPERPDGRALLVMPGGGYEMLSVENEGIDVGKRFTPRGITVAVLTYRLPAEGWDDQADVPLQDAQRAMRLLRARAGNFGIDPGRIAALGFSAGGHLAASLTTNYDERVYDPVDAADRQSARPAASGLIYPVISMTPPITHQGSRDHLLGASPAADLVRRRSPAEHVNGQTPPCFLVHATDDDVVPIQNSLDMFAACRAAKVPVETHLFEKGGHGFGLHLHASNSGSLWPDLFERWLDYHL